MKKIILAAVTALFGTFLTTFASPREDVTMTPEISGNYDTVKVGGEFRLVYCEASEPMKIIANDKVIQNIECVVENNALVVRYISGKSVKAIVGGRSPIVYIPANPNIKNITLSGTTHMECTSPIVQDDLSFNLSGASRVTGEVKSSKLSIHCAGTVNVTLTGVADAAHIKMDGASRVALGEGFECNTAEVNINGAGILRISCKEKLSGKIAGTSVVKYIGEPEVAIVTNGLASITAVK